MYTIGFINSSIHYPWAEYQLSGLISAAENLGVNLCVIPGGRLNSPYPDEKQQNFIYKALNYQSLDGIIIWGAGLIDDYNTTEEITKFIELFRPLPVIMMEHAVPGCPLITMDCYTPLKETVNHLIREHSVSKIGYIRGPVNHVSESDRFQAYLDAMEENGLTVKDEWVVPPYICSSDEEVETLRLKEWFREYGSELEAMASFNDQRLFFLLDALEPSGVRFPEDLLVCGYDDVRRARYYKPEITTVRAPFKKMAKKAIEIIADMIEGREVPERTEFTGEVRIRESCGCVYHILPKQRFIESREELLQFEKRAHKQLMINSIAASLPTLPGYKENRTNFAPTLKAFLQGISISECSIYLFGQIVRDERTLSPLRLYFSTDADEDDPRFEEYINPEDLICNLKGQLLQRNSFIIMPISSKQDQFGILILGLDEFDGSIYRSIQVFLGAFFREFRLLEKISRQSNILTNTNKKLQDSLEDLQNTKHLLVQSEKIAALSSLTNGIAHKINIPLETALKEATSLGEKFREMEETSPGPEGWEAFSDVARKSLNNISESMGIAAKLINQFKTISSAHQAEQPGQFSLYDFFQETAGFCRARWGDKVDIFFSCPEDLSLTSFHGVLTQIITHLVENSAIHAVDDESKCRILLKVEKKKDGFHIILENDGPCIPENFISKIFNPFFTTKGCNDRPGLGLYIVYNLVTQSLKGDISCSNLPEKGVRFEIILPAEEDKS